MDAQVLAALGGQVGALIPQLRNTVEAEALLEVLLAQAEQVRVRRAQLSTVEGPVRRLDGADTVPANRVLVRRVLVIDAAWPRPDQDAGSQAILAHMRSLRRLGWQVSLVTRDCVGPDAATRALLRAEQVGFHAPPSVMSVEEVLSRQAGSYQLIYLHRGAVAAPYVALVRHYQPTARVICNLADLAHVRVARQAQVEGRPELMRHAHWLKRQELETIRQVDAVITHSAAEAALLAREDIGAASLHVVPWAVTTHPAAAARPWEARNGVVLVANFAHPPNGDGVAWFVGKILPRVLAAAPGVIFTVVGRGMAMALARQIAGPQVHVLGHVPDLAPIYARSRLAVAPLRFGAGLKGKVLEAWAHGVPCAMTPVAAEGLPLEGGLEDAVAGDAAGLARVIIDLHEDAARNDGLAGAARRNLRMYFTQKRCDAALAAAIVMPGKGKARGFAP